MLRSLHEKTAVLPDADGVYTEYPTQTVDAIVSGCQHAQAGAVERIYDLYRRGHADLLCLVSGGAAKALPPHLAIVFRLSLIHISEPTRLGMISYAVFC